MSLWETAALPQRRETGEYLDLLDLWPHLEALHPGKILFIERSKPPARRPQPPQGCNPAVLAVLAGAWIAEIALDLYLTAERILSR